MSNFEGAYTLGSIFRYYERKHREPELCVHPHFDSLLPNVKMKINNLKKTVFSSLKIIHNSAKNVQRGEATSLMIDALLFKKGEITKAHKEMIKDSYKDTIMKSYQTRIRDRAEVPRTPWNFRRQLQEYYVDRRITRQKTFFWNKC